MNRLEIENIQQVSSNLLSCLKLNRAVYPTQPIAPQNSEFFNVSKQRRIRIIHVNSKIDMNERGVSNLENELGRSFRLSTEEYWFTRWNRPMRSSVCNCSFRVSQQNRNSIRIVFRIENYVEKLIGDVLLAAFKHYKNVVNGIDRTPDGIVNTAFEDENVVLRNHGINRKCDNKKCRNEKPLVMLLHGIGSSADVWWDILECLVCAGYEVLAPDMLGHGYSSMPDCARAYTFTNLLNDTLAVFDEYVGKTKSKKCIVVGHSYGCSLAGALARYREQQVVQLVLISGGGPTPLAPPVVHDETPFYDCIQFIIKPLLFCGVKRAAFYSFRGKHFDICDPDSARAIPSYILRYIMEGQYWPEGDAAFHRRILIPTLLVHGLQDCQVTLVQECEMERTIPRAFLEVIGTAGHAVMTETPEQLCHMLLCFFQWWSK